MPVKFSKKYTTEAKTDGFETVLVCANNLSKDSSPKDIETVLISVAKGDFKLLEFEKLISVVQSATKIQKTVIRKEIQNLQHKLGKPPIDVAFRVARQVFVSQFEEGQNLHREPSGEFFKFCGTHWKQTNRSYLRKLLQVPSKNFLHEFTGGGLSVLVGQALVCLEDMLGTDEAVLQNDDDVLPIVNVENGELHIDKNGNVVLKPHNPASGLMSCLPFEYDPGAQAPLFEQTLEEIFSSSDNVFDLSRHLLELFGYAIQPARPIPSFWLLIGNGANGKSKLLETLQRLLGPSAALNDNTAQFMRDRFNTAYLEGKLLFVDDDLSEATKLDDGLIKSISEAKAKSARKAYGKEKRDFICRALPILAGNTYPMTADVSYGMFRRANVIPFHRVFSKQEQDPTRFPQIWEKEMPGILNLALEGLKRVCQRGWSFDPPGDCIQAQDEFFRHANPLAAFLHERCVNDVDARTRLMDFRSHYKAWGHEQGIKNIAFADNTLRRKLLGLDYKVTPVKGYQTIFGLELSSPGIF